MMMMIWTIYIASERIKYHKAQYNRMDCLEVPQITRLELKTTISSVEINRGKMKFASINNS